MPSSSSGYTEHPLVREGAVEYRLYQENIAKEAYKRNTLVILPTALGKTVISALVAAKILYNYRDKRVLVMAPTRPLVMQHRESFVKILKLRGDDTPILTGKMPAKYREVVWQENARTIFATPQVVKNDILHHGLSLRDFGLLIFDECHRAVKDYAYTEVAKRYISEAPYPLILGMTASPGADPKRVKAVCDALFIEHVEYRSETDDDVRPYLHPIELEWKRVSLPDEYKHLGKLLRDMLDSKLQWLCRYHILHRKPEYITRRELIAAGDELRHRLQESSSRGKGMIYAAIMTQSLSLTLFHALELLESQGIHALRAFLERVKSQRSTKRSYARLLKDPAYLELEQELASLSVEHPKLSILTNCIQDQLDRKPTSRILVFTQYRDTASHLVDKLSGIPEVKVERFVGQASRLNDRGLTQDEQAGKLKRLREGEINALVATSIAEEGLDIPEVDLVIFYEPVPSEIRYIQRRGRTGRIAPGKVIILVAESKFDLAYLYSSRRKVERMRNVASSLNLKLKPILRSSPVPKPNPMSLDELKVGEEAEPTESDIAVTQVEEEKLDDFNRKVERAGRSIYFKLLKAGPLGIETGALTAKLEVEGYQAPVVSAALERLTKEGQLSTLGKKVALTGGVKASGKTYEVLVERILPGEAVVWVNEKWRARLAAEEFDGPARVIKKNSRFRATGELYRKDGVLCLRVSRVIQTLNN
jgi:Fanconi anemia group M protein